MTKKNLLCLAVIAAVFVIIGCSNPLVNQPESVSAQIEEGDSVFRDQVINATDDYVNLDFIKDLEFITFLQNARLEINDTNVRIALNFDAFRSSLQNNKKVYLMYYSDKDELSVYAQKFDVEFKDSKLYIEAYTFTIYNPIWLNLEARIKIAIDIICDGKNKIIGVDNMELQEIETLWCNWPYGMDSLTLLMIRSLLNSKYFSTLHYTYNYYSQLPDIIKNLDLVFSGIYYQSPYVNVIIEKYKLPAPRLSGSWIYYNPDGANIKLTRKPPEHFEVTLGWNAVADATDYEVWEQRPDDGGFKYLYTTKNTSISSIWYYEPGHYFFRVRAKSSTTMGEFSNTLEMNLYK